MDKIASQIPVVVTEARDHLKKMAGSLVASESRCSALEKELRFHKIARRMEERRIDDDLNFDAKLSKLASIPTNRLDAFETALEISPGGFKLGSLQDEEAGGDSHGRTGAPARKALDDFITSGAARS